MPGWPHFNNSEWEQANPLFNQFRPRQPAAAAEHPPIAVMEKTVGLPALNLDVMLAVKQAAPPAAEHRAPLAVAPKRRTHDGAEVIKRANRPATR